MHKARNLSIKLNVDMPDCRQLHFLKNDNEAPQTGVFKND